MTVGLALCANPQAPFERLSVSYHQYHDKGEIARNKIARNPPRLPNLAGLGLADRSNGFELARKGLGKSTASSPNPASSRSPRKKESKKDSSRAPLLQIAGFDLPAQIGPRCGECRSAFAMRRCLRAGHLHWFYLWNDLPYRQTDHSIRPGEVGDR
jgi:hypothetical protein